MDRVTVDGAVERICEFIKADSGFHLVLTADSSMLVLGQDDPEMAAIFQQASLVTPDSAGVLWAASRKGTPLPQKVSGVVIAEHLCAASAKHGFSIYFLGAAPGVAEEAAANMRAKYPGCKIVGARDGFFPKSEDANIAREIGKLRPDLLLVAMGIPRQEKFLTAHAQEHGAKVGIGVGGSFDVFSGRVKRAPLFIQKVNMEWLWRLMLNPKKLPKAATLPKFMLRVLKSK